MAKSKNLEDRSSQLNLFDFGFDENNNYVNIVEQEQMKLQEEWKEYSYEELISGYEKDNNYCICAIFSLGCLTQHGMTLEQSQRDIKKQAQTKCYHFGNMDKGIYAYSFRIDYEDGDKDYLFAIENSKHIAVVRHISDINDVLTGKQKLGYPAVCVYLFEITENGLKIIDSGWGEYKQDIRYKILCDEFEILKFSTNRIDPSKKPKDFYECEFALSDFANYHKSKESETNYEDN